MLHLFRNQLLTNNLCENFQSAYRAHHSTETALLDVMNCILGSADKGQVSVLTLLDLSAAFDRLVYTILLTRVHDMFSIAGKALQWFSSYLSDRAQAVSVNSRVSSQKKLHYGFLKVQTWVQYSLLCTSSHCLQSFLEVGAVITNLLMILNFNSLRLHLTFIH